MREPSLGCAPMMRTAGFFSFRKRDTPVMVPVVPIDDPAPGPEPEPEPEPETEPETEPAGETEVYDLTVDRLHNFIANDVVVHNSIEQDADLVMFIYREEYYDRDSEREGIADLMVAKHRNGGLGNVELTFQKEYPRFMSYVSEDRY